MGGKRIEVSRRYRGELTQSTKGASSGMKRVASTASGTPAALLMALRSHLSVILRQVGRSASAASQSATT